MFKNRWANTYRLLFWPEYNESYADSSIISKHKLFNFDFQLPSFYWKSHYQWLLGLLSSAQTIFAHWFIFLHPNQNILP